MIEKISKAIDTITNEIAKRRCKKDHTAYWERHGSGRKCSKCGLRWRRQWGRSRIYGRVDRSKLPR